MNIIILTIGTRGDVQPFLALAVGLKNAGHDVTIAASYTYAEWIKSYGIGIYPIDWSVKDFLQDPEIAAGLQSRNMYRVFEKMRICMREGILKTNDQLWEMPQKFDLVIQTTPMLCGIELAELHNIPMVNAFATPVYTPPTRDFPWFGLPWRFSLGGLYNYITHTAVHNGPAIEPLNHWRKTRLDLPERANKDALNPERQPGVPALYSLSPFVIPKPNDWGERHHINGYWFLNSPESFEPPADLVHFLESGPPPVYVGFGSMSDRDPERVTQITLQALKKTGQRAVLESGWGGIRTFPSSDDVFFINKNVTHDWLFPRVSAALHHGGAGTTSAAIRAGIPNIIAPFTLDQYAWADIISKKGLGVRAASNVNKLNEKKLRFAIEKVMQDVSIRQRAAALGHKVRAEDGVGVSVQLIEQHARKFYQ